MFKKLIVIIFCSLLCNIVMHGQRRSGLVGPEGNGAKYRNSRLNMNQERFYRSKSYGLVRVKTPQGYTNITEVNIGLGLGDKEIPYANNQMGLTMVNGYHITPFFLVGAGVGIQSYNKGVLAPVYLDARYYFRFKFLNPFLMVDAGGLFQVSGERAKNGKFIYPAAGVRVPVSRRLSVTTALGWHAHWNKPRNNRDSFVAFKVGVVFY